MNFGEMRLELGDLFGHGANPAPEVGNRFDRWVNSVYKETMAEKGFGRLKKAVLTFSSVANDPFAVLPHIVGRINHLVDRTNGLELWPAEIADIRREDPNNTGVGTYATNYVPLNYGAAAARDPSNASELFVKSTSAHDGTGQVAYLEAIRTGGYRRRLSITMNGTTAVSFDATVTDLTNVLKFYVASPAVGDITLHEDSGVGTELARIPAGRTYARYSRILLWPTPSSVVTYHADVELAIYPLELDSDEPVFHEDFDFLLPCGAAMREFQKLGKVSQYDRERTRWRNGYANLKVRLAQDAALTIERGRRFSHLGPYFPIGS